MKSGLWRTGYHHTKYCASTLDATLLNITDYWYISLNEKKVSSEHGEENGYQLRGESNFVFALVYIAAPCDWLGSLATVSNQSVVWTITNCNVRTRVCFPALGVGYNINFVIWLVHLIVRAHYDWFSGFKPSRLLNH